MGTTNAHFCLEVSSFPLNCNRRLVYYCYLQRFGTPVTVTGGRTLWSLYVYSSSIFPGFTYLTRDSSKFRFPVTFLYLQLIVNRILLTLLTKEVTVVFSLEESVRTFQLHSQARPSLIVFIFFLGQKKKKKKA